MNTNLEECRRWKHYYNIEYITSLLLNNSNNKLSPVSFNKIIKFLNIHLSLHESLENNILGSLIYEKNIPTIKISTIRGIKHARFVLAKLIGNLLLHKIKDYIYYENNYCSDNILQKEQIEARKFAKNLLMSRDLSFILVFEYGMDPIQIANYLNISDELCSQRYNVLFAYKNLQVPKKSIVDSIMDSIWNIF